MRPEHHVPDGEEVAVLPPETLVLAHVVLDQLDQGGRVQLVQPTLVDLLLGGWSRWGEAVLDLGVVFTYLAFSRNAQCNLKTKTMQVVHAFYFLLTLHLIVHHSRRKETKRITEKQRTLRLTQPYLQMKRREETRRRVSRDIPVKGLDGPLPGRLRRYVRIWLWQKLRVFFSFVFT